MNEEQLKEIAILAKELGFKPRTYSTAEVFFDLICNKERIDLEDVSSYLLLCEIQKWLREVHKIECSVVRHEKNKYYWSIEDDNTDFEYFSDNSFKTFELALATGILEGLKLIKK